MIHAPVRASHHSARVPGSRPKKFILPPCRVCGDKAAGFHYGANTCEACKGFFHRSLRRKEDYKCLGVGSGCDVRPGKQRSCPRCRFQKCLDAGMSRAAIKTGRYTYVKRNQDNLEVQSLQRMSRQYEYSHHHHHHHHHHHRMAYPHANNTHTYLPASNPNAQFKSPCDQDEPIPFNDKNDFPEAMIPIFLQASSRKEEFDVSLQSPPEETLPARHEIGNHALVSADATMSPLASPLPLSTSSSSGFSSTSVEVGDSEPKNFSMENFEVLDFLDLTDNTISHVTTVPSSKNRSHDIMSHSKFPNLDPSGDCKAVSSIMNKSNMDNYPSKQYQSSFRPHFNSSLSCSWHVPESKGSGTPFYADGMSSIPYRQPSMSSSSQHCDLNTFKEGPCVNPISPHNNAYYHKFDQQKAEQVLGYKQNISASPLSPTHESMFEAKLTQMKGQNHHLVRNCNFSASIHPPTHINIDYEVKPAGWAIKGAPSCDTERYENSDITLILGL